MLHNLIPGHIGNRRPGHTLSHPVVRLVSALYKIHTYARTGKPRFTYSSIYVLLIYLLIFLNASIYIRTQNSIYILHLAYLHLIYVLSKVRITNTGVGILKYEGPIELHRDVGNWFIRIEIVHNFHSLAMLG